MAWLQRKFQDKGQDIYQQALEEFPRPAWFRDSKLNLTWVNQAYVDASGAARETILMQQKELLRHTTDPDGRMLARQPPKGFGGIRQPFDGKIGNPGNGQRRHEGFRISNHAGTAGCWRKAQIIIP